MNPLERWSLVALWWGTALVSVLGWGGISHALVSEAGLVPAVWVSPLVAAGIALDLAMGAWLVWRPAGRASWWCWASRRWPRCWWPARGCTRSGRC